MTINNSEYWKQRFELLEKSSNANGRQHLKQIEYAFDEAQREMQSKIDVWYARFAKNNEINMTEAKRLLNTKELAELKWDVKDYIKQLDENAINQRWIKELENASAKFHITRLESLKLHTQQQMEIAFGNELDSVDTMARKIYTEDFYKSAYEIQKGLNVGFNVGVIDDKILNKIIPKPWAADGKNFSDRVWQSKTKMVNELHNELIKTCILGKSPDDAIKNMTKFVDSKFKNAKLQARRLVMTEQAYFSAAAKKDCFNDLDVEYFEILATLDYKTSPLCQQMDGKHLPMSEYKEGVTAPPLHVECRSVAIPYFNDEWSGGSRAARDEDGKTYYLPSDMKYDEWKKTYVKDSISDKAKSEFAKYQNILGDKIPTLEEFTKIKYNGSEWEAFKAYASAIKSGELSPLADFDLYKNISKQIDSELVGKITSNNITIKGKSNHFVARTIGSVEQRRSGVTISETIDALLKPDSVDAIRELKNGRSQRFISDKVLVTVNPDTGKLIQVNPRKRRKKVGRNE